MSDILQSALDNMDEEQAKNLMSQLDEEQLSQAITWVLDQQLAPHLHEIRQRSQSRDDPYRVREYFSNMSEEEQEEAFYDALQNLVAALVQCRSDPNRGFQQLKSQLRDPYTAEALLLIFENEDHIDQQYSQTLKEFAGKNLKWASALVMPEMYTEQERKEALENYGPDNR